MAKTYVNGQEVAGLTQKALGEVQDQCSAALTGHPAITTINNEISSLSDDMNSLSSAIATVDNEVSTLTDNVQTIDNTLSTAMEVIRKGTGAELAANKSLIDVAGVNGTSTINYFGSGSIRSAIESQHLESFILFVIPEAVASINAHNSAIRTELHKLGEVFTITQADALTYPDFEGLSIVVLGTNNGTDWTTSNLAHIKAVPNLPVLCCDATSATYMKIGTDGGNAASKTVLNGVANIEGSILGNGYHGLTGLAVGANTIADAGTTFSTLDMSNANLTETYYGYEAGDSNADVLLGLIRRIQPDATIGIDLDATEIKASVAFYGPAYSYSSLNTLGQNVLIILTSMLIHGTTIGQALTISGDIGDLETKTFGNMSTKHNNATPLAAFISGNTGGTGTELPNDKSLYDVLKIVTAAVQTIDNEVSNIDDQISTLLQDNDSLSSAIATIDNEVSTIDNQLSTVLQRQNALSSAIDAVSTPLTDITKGCSLAIATAAINATVPLTTLTKGASLAIATAGVIQTIDNEISTIDDQISTVLQDIDSLSSAIATIDNEVSTVQDTVNGLSTAIQRKPVGRDWWSAITPVVTITGTSTAKALPEVTIPSSGGNRLPAGATIQGAIAMVKFRKLENTNATNVNALSHVQHLQVRDDGGGSWHNALTLPSGLLEIATATIEGGDLWIGNIDLSSTGYIDGADTYEFQIDEAHAEQTDLELRGLQSGIRVYYY